MATSKTKDAARKAAPKKAAPKPAGPVAEPLAETEPEYFESQEAIREFLLEIDSDFEHISNLAWFGLKAPDEKHLAVGLKVGDFDWKIDFDNQKWAEENPARLPSRRMFREVNAGNVNKPSPAKSDAELKIGVRATHLHTGASVFLRTHRVPMQASKQARQFVSRLLRKYVNHMRAA